VKNRIIKLFPKNTSRSIGEVTVEKIGKSAVFFGVDGYNILCEK
jgi:hypothetical protein